MNSPVDKFGLQSRCLHRFSLIVCRKLQEFSRRGECSEEIVSIGAAAGRTIVVQYCSSIRFCIRPKYAIFGDGEIC